MSAKQHNYLKSDPDLSSVLCICGHLNAADLMDFIFSDSSKVEHQLYKQGTSC